MRWVGTFSGNETMRWVERSRDPGQRVEAVPGSPAFFEPGDDGLRGPHPFGERPLAEPGPGSQVMNELTEGEVLFDRSSHLRGGSSRRVLTSSHRE